MEGGISVSVSGRSSFVHSALPLERELNNSPDLECPETQPTRTIIGYFLHGLFFCHSSFLRLTFTPMLDDSSGIALLERALETYTRHFCVHRYPSPTYHEQLVHYPEAFEVSEVSLYVYRIHL